VKRLAHGMILFISTKTKNNQGFCKQTLCQNHSPGQLVHGSGRVPVGDSDSHCSSIHESERSCHLQSQLWSSHRCPLTRSSRDIWNECLVYIAWHVDSMSSLRHSHIQQARQVVHTCPRACGRTSHEDTLERRELWYVRTASDLIHGGLTVLG